MSPTRKEDDFRSKSIEDWDDWIEKEIRDSMGRGEFSNLPGHGKPIRIESNPFDPSMDMAYSRLKNAGYAPTWMELDRQITAARTDLNDFLHRSETYLETLRAHVAEHDAAPAPGDEPETRSALPRWALWRRLLQWLDFADAGGETRESPLTHADLVRIREHMRRQYLERAADIDKTIGTFHAALPPTLWHLQRTTLSRERAERVFDARIRPVSH